MPQNENKKKTDWSQYEIKSPTDFSQYLVPEGAEKQEGSLEALGSDDFLTGLAKRLGWAGVKGFAGSSFGPVGGAIGAGSGLLFGPPDSLGGAVTDSILSTFGGGAGNLAEKGIQKIANPALRFGLRGLGGTGMNVAAENIDKNISALSDEDTAGITPGGTGVNIFSGLLGGLLGGVSDKARKTNAFRLPQERAKVQTQVGDILGEGTPVDMKTERLFIPDQATVLDPMLARRELVMTKLQYHRDAQIQARDAQKQIEKTLTSHDLALDKAQQRLSADKINIDSQIKALQRKKVAIRGGYDPDNDTFFHDLEIDAKPNAAAINDPIFKALKNTRKTREAVVKELKANRIKEIDDELAPLFEQQRENKLAELTKVSKDLGGSADPALRTIVQNTETAKAKAAMWGDEIKNHLQSEKDLVQSLSGRAGKTLFRDPHLSALMKPDAGEVAPTNASIMRGIREGDPEHITAVFKEVGATKVPEARNVILRDIFLNAVDPKSGELDFNTLTKFLTPPKINALYGGGTEGQKAVERLTSFLQDVKQLQGTWKAVEQLEKLGVKGVLKGEKLGIGMFGAGLVLHSLGVPYGLAESIGLATINWTRVLDAVMSKNGTFSKTFHDFATRGGLSAAAQAIPEVSRVLRERSVPVPVE